jgi:hypothetical protein
MSCDISICPEVPKCGSLPAFGNMAIARSPRLKRLTVT